MKEYTPFIKAKAVWAAGKAREVNATCVFSARVPLLQSGMLRVTASCLYRAFFNGKLIAYGPARAAHGFFRVDEIPLPCNKADNTLVIEVAGYNCNSFYTLNQPSFLCAEITDGNSVIAYTDAPCVGFLCSLSNERLQKVPRFSYQRAFTESYVFRAPHADFGEFCGEPTETERSESGVCLARNVSYPTYEYQKFTGCAYGKVTLREPQEKFPRERYLVNDNLVIFPEGEWETDACDTAYNFVYRNECAGETGALHAGEYAVFSCSQSLTGFLETKLYADEDSLVYILFDEVDFRRENDADGGIGVCFWRNDSLNLITYAIKKGEFAHVSFEAYTAKYIKVVVLEGKIRNLQTGVRRYENPDAGRFLFHCEDEKLNAVTEAARQTFAQNAVDILTDCPSRERAGWLCDSYFSGQAEKLLTGENRVERNFLENYCYQSQNFAFGQEVLAMCYPAEFADGEFIPNWMLFWLLELESYFERTGDTDLIEKAAPRARKILSYFQRFENEYGLLENLESWVFVEWSKANDAEFIKGVNFPSNMLYAKALECFGKLYKSEDILAKAERLKEEIRKRSYNGKLFEDNLVRENGELKRFNHTSETCQYYAFYFGIADEVRYPELYRFVFGCLGPHRDSKTEYADVFVSNAFIGNLLRLDYLLRKGRGRQFLDESKEYYYKMASCTGTLWEHNQVQHSLNHGFASYVANMIVRCITGFCGIDERKKQVFLANASVPMACKVKIPAVGGCVEIVCSGAERTVHVPAGYTVVREETALPPFGTKSAFQTEPLALAGNE